MKKIAVILLSLAILLVVCAVVFLNLKKNDTKKTQTKNKISYYECVKEESINKYLTSRNIQKIYYDKDKNITKIDETKEYNVVDDIEYEAIKDYFSNCKDSYKEGETITQKTVPFSMAAPGDFLRNHSWIIYIFYMDTKIHVQMVTDIGMRSWIPDGRDESVIVYNW